MYKSVSQVTTNSDGQEIKNHGTLDYPVGCYYNDMSKAIVIWHWHEELELIFATKGVVKVGAGQVEEILREGDGCFINSDVTHSVCRIESQDGIVNSIVFHPKLIGDRHSIYWKKYIQPLVENKNQQFIFFNSKLTKDSQIVDLIRSAWNAEAEEKPGFEFEVRNLLSQIIFFISDGETGKVYRQTKKELRDMERTKLMITYIESNFANDINLNQVAKTAALSESECMHCFKRSTGLSPMQFLKVYRLLRSAELIRSTSMNISEIAAQCGFLDMSYFAKSFRQVFNVSPTTYRQNEF